CDRSSRPPTAGSKSLGMSPSSCSTAADVLPPGRADIQKRAIESLARRDPRAAYIRATRLPRGLNRAFAIESLANSFARRDPDAALAWARSLAAKEPGVLGLLVTGFADADPLRALDLALQIDTPAEQTWALQEVVGRAASRDPDAARAYIESHVADPNRREQVLSLLARRQADAVTRARAPVSAPEPPVVAVQGDMVSRQQRLFAPPPADSRFEPLSR